MKSHPYRLANFLAILSLLGAANAAAETVIISGRIVDQQEQAIAAATILIDGDEYRCDKSGDFSIAISSGEIYRLKVSAPGYCSDPRLKLTPNNARRSTQP